MTTTPDPVADLRAIREQWGDLLAAIDQPPATEWPPRDSRALGIVPEHPADEPQCYACSDGGACAGGPCAVLTPAVGRVPLTLREHPAPLNLGALDAAMETETDLFGLADFIAGGVQRSMQRVPWPNVGSRVLWTPKPSDRTDPDRWHYATPTWPGSRVYGLHWAAVWIEGALAGTNDLCAPVAEVIRDEAVQTAARARGRVERALARDGRVTALPAPCPWCGGELTARTTSGDPWAAVVTCGTGPTCVAPTPYDSEARRVWRGRDLVGLWSALDAKRRKASA